MNITKEQAALARAVLKDFADEQRRKARVAFGNYRTSASTADKSAFMQANEAADNAEYVAKRMQASPPKQSTPQPDGGAMALTLETAPVGTQAHAIGGGHWTRVEGGWKWCNGAIFPRPGGDWDGRLILPKDTRPSAAAAVGSCEDPRLKEAGYFVCGSNADREWHFRRPNGTWRDRFTTEDAAVNAALDEIFAAEPAAPAAPKGGESQP